MGLLDWVTARLRLGPTRSYYIKFEGTTTNVPHVVVDNTYPESESWTGSDGESSNSDSTDAETKERDDKS